MLFVDLYLVSLFIAPQLWFPPLLGLPTDYVLTPFLFLAIVVTGRLPSLMRINIYDGLFLGFIAIIAVSAVLNGMSDLNKLALTDYLKMFVTYKMVATLVDTVPRARHFAAVIVALVLLLSVEAIDHRFSPDRLGWAGQSLGWIDPEALAAGVPGRARWVGIFDGPGVFAVMFTIALPFVLQYTNGHYRKATRVFAALGTVLLLVATYFTGSRGGFLATLAVLTLHTMIRFKVSVRAMAISAAVGLAAYSVAPSYITTIRDQSNSTQYRVEMWAAGLDMMKQDPLFGIGRGNFREWSGKLIAHNSAIEIGGETGLLGLIVWTCLLWVAIKAALQFRAQAEYEEEKDFAIAVILSIIGYVASSMFVTLEYITLYLLIALASALARGQRLAVTLTGREVGIASVGLVLWLLAVQVFVVRYMG
jgi:O-antigen ligase